MSEGRDGPRAARGGDRWSRLAQAGPLFLVLGSAFTAPLFTAGTLRLTGDRLLGLAALVVVTGLGMAARLRWTPIHTALAVFVGMQVLTSMLNAGVWPQGLKFVTVYVLGFACFCLAAEWARSAEGQRRFGAWWITIGGCLGLIGTLLSVWANLTAKLRWGTGVVQGLWFGPAKVVFASQATFNEWNLFSSFLLIPLTLGLWRWPRDTHARWLTTSIGAVVFGLAFGFTRAAWLSMAGIIAFWWWMRRPRGWQLVALGAMLVLALLLQVAATSRPVPRTAYRSPVPASQPPGSHLQGTQLQETQLQREALLWREREAVLLERRRIRTVAWEEKRPMTQLEEQRHHQLSEEFRRIERELQAREPPFSTRTALADWFRTSSIWSRLVEPVKTGRDWNMMGRLAVGRVTIASWLLRPMLGHGAGSINRLSTVLPRGRQVQKNWHGNLVLFVLHDSGLLGLAALLGLAVAVCRQGVGAISLGADRAIPSLAVPLLAVGGALCFAYQFTHGLWVMYPYVYLGLLTGATDDASSRL